MNTLHQNLAGERANNGSRDSIDLQAHWTWRNPLNLLPLGIAGLAVLGIALMLLK